MWQLFKVANVSLASWIAAGQVVPIVLLCYLFVRSDSDIRQLKAYIVATEVKNAGDVALLRDENTRLSALNEEVERKLRHQTTVLEEAKLAANNSTRDVRADLGSRRSSGGTSAGQESGESDAARRDKEAQAEWDRKEREKKACRDANERCMAGCEGLSSKGWLTNDRSRCRGRCAQPCGW